MKVTAVLLKYKRHKELDEIVKYLESKDYINEILIHNNSGCHNLINYGRYVQAKKAKNPIIYTQDDDCIVEDIDKLYKTFMDNNCNILVNGMKKSHTNKYKGRTSMCGWGTFFKKKWINVLDIYLKKYGEDYCFYRETDRIFTGLLPDRKTLEVSIKDFPSATDDFALYKQSDHNQYAKMAKDRVNEIIACSTQ